MDLNTAKQSLTAFLDLMNQTGSNSVSIRLNRTEAGLYIAQLEMHSGYAYWPKSFKTKPRRVIERDQRRKADFLKRKAECPLPPETPDLPLEKAPELPVNTRDLPNGTSSSPPEPPADTQSRKSMSTRPADKFSETASAQTPRTVARHAPRESCGCGPCLVAPRSLCLPGAPQTPQQTQRETEIPREPPYYSRPDTLQDEILLEKKRGPQYRSFFNTKT